MNKLGYTEAIAYTMNRNHFPDFFRTFSYREVLTLICIPLFMIGFDWVRDFYYDTEFFQFTYNAFFNLCFYTFVIYVGHFIYKAEHKRFNVFYVRLVYDFSLVVVYALFRNYLYHEIKMDLLSVFSIITYIFFVEILFSNLKYFLGYIK